MTLEDCVRPVKRFQSEAPR